ncbi:MAG: hypothetical protein GC191_12965 [Azospirillum sp.]|nr:hypothetical protein [Azospirillum sp.]
MNEVPHFFVETNEDRKVHQVLKDGKPHNAALKLEQLFSVVAIYFKLAALNLKYMEHQDQSEGLRGYGVQSFLMSLTALEAFTNVYFHLRAQELNSDAMRSCINQSHRSLSRKIADLLAMTPDGPLEDQEQLLERIFSLSKLRNELVHPRWTPSTLTHVGNPRFTVSGLVENPQALFEDYQLCREALLWSLLLVARVAQSRGNEDVSGFMFHWTGHYGCTLPYLLKELGLPGA